MSKTSKTYLRCMVSLLVGIILVCSPRSFILSVPATGTANPQLAPATSIPRHSASRFQPSLLSSCLPSTFSCGVMLLAAASASGASRVKKPQMKAESIFRGLEEMKNQDKEEEEQRKGGAVDESSMRVTENDLKEYMDKDFDETDLEEYAKQFAEEEAADTTARQIRYELYPSKQYVLYLAKKNAIKTWTSDGPDGKNRGCLEVQIAIATEKIRNMILHMREFRNDYKCRLKLVSLVCARRRMLDKLAAKDLDSYMKIREELKIRHVYRIEALKNRLGAYLYPIKDRPQAPGRKTLNRLKKSKQLMTRRLANQLRQGREHKIIHRTQKKLNFRRWLSRPYDEVAAWEKKNEVGKYVDPLNLP